MPRRLPWVKALGNTGNGLFVVDGTQRVVSWNRAAERLLGFAAASVVGCRCYDVVAGVLPSGEPWCRPNCGVQRSVRQGRLPPAVEITVLTKDKRTVRLDAACIVLPGKPTPLVAHLLRDVTAERCHEKELEKIRVILASGPGDRLVISGPPRCVDKRGLATTADAESTRRLSTLTPRERSVLLLLTGGLSGKSVAERLGISTFTVRSHVANVLHKLGVHRQAAAVAVALREGAHREQSGDLIQTD